MSKNRTPLRKREVNAIRKDFADGVAISTLVKKYKRHYYTLRDLLHPINDAALPGPPEKRKRKGKSAKQTELATVNEALSFANKGHGVHSALFKQIFALVKQQAPEVHRVSLDIETRQVTFETLSSHKVTL